MSPCAFCIATPTPLPALMNPWSKRTATVWPVASGVGSRRFASDRFPLFAYSPHAGVPMSTAAAVAMNRPFRLTFVELV